MSPLQTSIKPASARTTATNPVLLYQREQPNPGDDFSTRIELSIGNNGLASYIPGHRA
jgi:hypothetical protein